MNRVIEIYKGFFIAASEITEIMADPPGYPGYLLVQTRSGNNVIVPVAGSDDDRIKAAEKIAAKVNLLCN